MSSDKRPLRHSLNRPPRDTGGALVTRSFFRLLISFLIIDAVVMLCNPLSLWQWGILSGVEGLLLLFHVRRSDRMVLEMLERIDARYQAQVRFTSDASHELRTPISVIQGYASLLDRWGKDDPAIRQEAITAIRQEADSMAALVEQLLFLVRGDNESQAFSPAVLDLSALVTGVAKETAMVAPTHNVVSEVAEGITTVADSGLIKECLRILCENAVKYTPAGGSITIGLKRMPEGSIQIWVSDTGMGISQEDLPHIFDRFYRADASRSTDGTGLGLSIAAWIAARHKGCIEVTSLAGVGSRFALVLPADGAVQTGESPE